ncbi:MAG: KTSC domain-containing protein [Alphaproteobacteria bacterium]|nr:KTSC domain-containing protein [Alphaproteobacteria bacterium]
MSQEWTPVDSSNVAALAYDGTNLGIEFHGGRRYIYGRVPEELYEKLRHARSVGFFFAREIKGKFDVKWRGYACSVKPCTRPAVLRGKVAGVEFFVCAECAKTQSLANVVLTEIADGQ